MALQELLELEIIIRYAPFDSTYLKYRIFYCIFSANSLIKQGKVNSITLKHDYIFYKFKELFRRVDLSK